MSDSTIRNKTGAELEELSEDSEGQLKVWLRESSRHGVLPEAHAALDVAFARGYAQGVEQTKEESLDLLRTILVSWLEARFGEVSDRAMDAIAEAGEPMLEHWLLAAPAATSLEGLLSGSPSDRG